MTSNALASVADSVDPMGMCWDDQLCLDLVRTLLLRNATAQDLTSLIAIFGFDTSRHYVAFRGRPLAGRSLESLADELRATQSFQHRSGLIVSIRGELMGFGAIPQRDVCAGVVSVGVPGMPERLGESFRVASRVLNVAQMLGYSGLHSLDTLGLLPTIIADADVGETLQRRYLVRAQAAESLPDLLGTIRSYFACGMDIDGTAAVMNLHPNTVRNRIAKFEVAAGANLRDRMVAMEVWWALERTRITGLPVDHSCADLPDHSSRPLRSSAAKQRAEFLRGLLRGTLRPAALRHEIITHGVDGIS